MIRCGVFRHGGFYEAVTISGAETIIASPTAVGGQVANSAGEELFDPTHKSLQSSPIGVGSVDIWSGASSHKAQPESQDSHVAHVIGSFVTG